MKTRIRAVLLICLAFVPVSAISLRAKIAMIGINTAEAAPRSEVKTSGSGGVTK